VATVVLFKQIKLALGTHVAGKPQLFEFAVHIPQKATAVAAKGCAVRLFHVAEELHHPALGGTPRQDGHGGKIRPQYKVAFLNVHKACNGAAVKAHALFQCLGQVASQHGNVLLGAKIQTCASRSRQQHIFPLGPLRRLQLFALQSSWHTVLC
jgi:hypothetical protein